MVFSIVEFFTKIVIGFFVGGLIAVPVVLIIWKLKMRKIRKSIPENIEEKIKEFKNNERRVEDERRKREQTRKDRRNQRAADTIKPGTGNSIKDSTRRNVIERRGSISKTTPASVKRTKPDSKGNWPSFE